MENEHGRSLRGRTIEDGPYTALIDNMNRIAAVAHFVAESPEGFAKGDLLNMIEQMGALAAEAVTFAGATREEAADSLRAVIGGASFASADD